MKNTIRTFIAIKIIPNNELQAFLAKAKTLFSDESIKWVDTSNLHLTLRFLGETSNDQVQQIIYSLNKIADQFSSFSIRLIGAGYFNKNKIPRVLFVSIKENSSLKNLAGLIDRGAREAGFTTEIKNYNPHLTLGRIKSIKNKERFLQFTDIWKDVEFQTVEVKQMVFYQSILNEKVPVYRSIAEIKIL